jgi:hypothetical protein
MTDVFECSKNVRMSLLSPRHKADHLLVPDGQEVIPYTVWGNLKKIVIRVPTELRFHDTMYDAKPIDIAQTSWINYVLEDERSECNYLSLYPILTLLDSSAFQSALMGKSLVLSVNTNKTMRIHEGLMADTFSYQEQMCALENMRIWQDHETNSFMAMIHFSAHFRDGYMAFYRTFSFLLLLFRPIAHLSQSTLLATQSAYAMVAPKWSKLKA